VAEVLQSVFAIVNRKFGGYLRGQLILAVCYGVLTFVITWVFGLTYGAFIAVFAAVMMLVPFVGTYAAIIPPIIGFILLHIPDPSFPFGSFGLLLLLLILSQQLVINVLSPRVMGSALGMHPILVVLGLLLGVKVAGLWGAIFGVPVFGVLTETADLVYRRVVERRFGFHPPGPADRHDGAAPGGPGMTHGVEPGRDAPPPAEEATPALPRAGATLQPSHPHESRP
jgi:predicted PurR-regulated permease PerM